MMKGKAIIFSAPSGAGKTTIVKHLLQLDMGLEFSISACSRPPRQQEVDGRDYYFMSAADFRKHIAQDDFLEWEEVYRDHYYGTLKSELDRIWSRQKHVVFDVDVIGGLKLKEYFGQNALAVFVQSPSMQELKKRLSQRSTDTDDKIRDRMAKAASEMEFAPQFDVILVNDLLAETLVKGKKIVREFLDQPLIPEKE
jgi:guanylate kinase